MKYTYIKKTIPNYYFITEEQLTEDNCDILGSTFQDFIDDKFVPLNDEQIDFAKKHPEANIKEVFEMKIFVPEVIEKTIEEIRLDKLRDLQNYDNGYNVNSFTINNAITTWFTPTERGNYKQSVESAELIGINTLKFYVNDILLEVETQKAKQMLAYIQLYADECFIVTKQHKLAIEKLETIDEINNYDFTTGYPEKLNFNI